MGITRSFATAAIAFLAVAPGMIPTSLAAQDSRPGVGVLPFRNGGSFGDDPLDYERLEVGVQQILMTELELGSDLRIVERSFLRDLLAEQDLSPDRVDAQTAAEIGKVVGAKYMILGGFVDIRGNFRLDARIVDTETTEILSARRVEGDSDELLEMIVELAGELAQAAQFAPLPAREVDTREASSEVPYLAVKRYSRAIELQDAGYVDEAQGLLQDLLDDFPSFVQARQALEQTH
jgi:curli biogenesis system outer membrane secretion channel CsgG